MDVLACDHQTACILGLRSARERQTASSFGFRQTLWNVLMKKELILGQNFCGSPKYISQLLPTEAHFYF